jgi:hypothetical protein
MKSAWALLNAKYPWIYCYGCAAHCLNLLAADFRKIDAVKDTLDANRSVSKLFREHQAPKAVLEEKTVSKNGKSLSCILGVPTRWSTEYYMVKRNIRLKKALMLSVLDSRCSKALASKKVEKSHILDNDEFWAQSRLVAALLEPVKDAIAEVGDTVPISIMPRLWKVLRHKVEKAAQQMLEKSIITTDDLELIMKFVTKREELCMQPVHMAASIVDPRFIGNDLSEEQTAVAESVILNVASKRQISELACLDDLADYRYGKPL